MISVAISASLFRHGLCRQAIAALRLRDDGRIDLIADDGLVQEASVLPDTTVMTRLIVLIARPTGLSKGKVILVLPVDAVGAEAHRRLRVWLKWRAALEPDAPPISANGESA